MSQSLFTAEAFMNYINLFVQVYRGFFDKQNLDHTQAVERVVRLVNTHAPLTPDRHGLLWMNIVFHGQKLTLVTSGGKTVAFQGQGDIPTPLEKEKYSDTLSMGFQSVIRDLYPEAEQVLAPEFRDRINELVRFGLLTYREVSLSINPQLGVSVTTSATQDEINKLVQLREFEYDILHPVKDREGRMVVGQLYHF